MRVLVVMISLVGAMGCKKGEEPGPRAVTAPAPAAVASRSLMLEVTTDGFVPASASVKVGEPLKLIVTRKTDETCATELLIEGTDIKRDLPLNTPVEIAWTPTKAGKVKFGCAMDMMVSGVLLVE